MLSSYEVELRASSDGNLPKTHGHLLHGIFLTRLHTSDASFYTSTMHSNDSSKPFALSPLYPKKNGAYQIINKLHAGNKLAFRIGIWDDKLRNLFENAFFVAAEATDARPTSVGDELQIEVDDTRQITIGETLFDLVSTRLISELDNDALLSSTPAADHLKYFTITFHTLTCFQSKGKSLLFPEPRLIVGSLVRVWRDVTHIDITDDEKDALCNSIHPIQYDLKTGVHDMGKYHVTGFHGKCAYAVDNSVSVELRRRLLELLKMMEITGVGYKTTMGMGRAGYSCSHVRLYNHT